MAQCLKNGRLECINSGQSSPCLDLSRLNKSLVELMTERKVDLLVLEGMGRAIETNLLARFTCDALNLGMVKHPEVAQELQGRMYDCVCRFFTPGQASGPA